MDGRQRSQITLDEWFDRRQVKAADKDKREVARICKPVLIDGQRFVEVPLIDHLGGLRLSSEMILVSGRGDRIEKRSLRASVLVGEKGLRLGGLERESVCVGPGLSEPEIDELEHRLQI